MSEISKLEPLIVWKIFDEITKVPRLSKKEEKIIKYLVDFAVEHKLDHQVDKAGNVVIRRAAAPSFKDRPTVVLQSHMDMVGEKNSDVKFDFDKDPIDAYVDDGWVKARGTTLGADCGIGMAASLAALIVKDVELPAIEALFTVDEETGLTGAFNLGEDMLTGKYLLNLDSEDDGEIFIGCAGGVDTIATYSYKSEKRPDGYLFFKVNISGLKGGHSGDDINKGLGNSNKLMARFLRLAQKDTDLRLSRFDGGNIRNAIPREAYAIFGVPVAKTKRLFEAFETFTTEVKSEYKITAPDLDIAISEVPMEDTVIDIKSQRGLIMSLQGVPNGVLAMSFAIPGLVETSSNLASVKHGKGDTIEVVTSQRSSVDGSRFDAAASVASVFELGGATIKHSEGYPGWNPDPSSHALAVTKRSYQKLFGSAPEVKAIHAGLECGLFLLKYPHLDMVSFGPTVRGAHSPDERIEISTVDKFWKLLIDTLKNL